ncbi:hypothetical protein CR513_49349, partial [Mucuna pruriens]
MNALTERVERVKKLLTTRTRPSILSHGESNDSTAEEDKREAETMVEDPTSTEEQFEEASIMIRSHQVMLHLCKNKENNFTAMEVKTVDSEETMKNLEANSAQSLIILESIDWTKIEDLKAPKRSLPMQIPRPYSATTTLQSMMQREIRRQWRKDRMLKDSSRRKKRDKFLVKEALRMMNNDKVIGPNEQGRLIWIYARKFYNRNYLSSTRVDGKVLKQRKDLHMNFIGLENTYD